MPESKVEERLKRLSDMPESKVEVRLKRLASDATLDFRGSERVPPLGTPEHDELLNRLDFCAGERHLPREGRRQVQAFGGLGPQPADPQGGLSSRCTTCDLQGSLSSGTRFSLAS